MNADKKLEIKIVQNEEERLKAFVVRSIVYIHEQDCPYDEEFDLNDFSATQILGHINGEPVLTARIRYFGTFAKLERLAIRSKYRGLGYGHELLKFMLGFCREKGFQEFYLHAQERLQPFYEGYGFERVGEHFAFSDHGYVEMRARLGSADQKAAIGQNPMIINRPEGSWDFLGPIEAAITRSPIGLGVS